MKWIRLEKPCAFFSTPHRKHEAYIASGTCYVCPGYPWWNRVAARLRRNWRKA